MLTMISTSSDSFTLLDDLADDPLYFRDVFFCAYTATGSRETQGGAGIIHLVTICHPASKLAAIQDFERNSAQHAMLS